MTTLLYVMALQVSKHFGDMLHMDNQKITLLSSLSHTITDYQTNGILYITPDHIDRWLSQFDAQDQLPILYEMDHIMKRFYFSRSRIKSYISNFIQKVISTNDPRTVLSHIQFISTRQSGDSQKMMFHLMEEVLLENYNLALDDIGKQETKIYVYLDDAIYTGNKLRYDSALQTTHSTLSHAKKLIIYVIAAHRSGLSYALNHVRNSCENFSITSYCPFSIEDRRFAGSQLEVLWPEYMANELIESYTGNLLDFDGKKLSNGKIFRDASNFPEKLFSSSQGREIVERAFLLKGLEIIQRNKRKAPSMRPLGFMKLASLGFGTFFITYRNIANNCPLVLWWGDPNYSPAHPFGQWYPLFPRKTNNNDIL